MRTAAELFSAYVHSEFQSTLRNSSQEDWIRGWTEEAERENIETSGEGVCLPSPLDAGLSDVQARGYTAGRILHIVNASAGECLLALQAWGPKNLKHLPLYIQFALRGFTDISRS